MEEQKVIDGTPKPTIGLSEFKARRRELMNRLNENSVAILPAASMSIRNSDVHYPYRQDSDFLYLTGFNEPAAVLVLIPNRPQGAAVLFCQERNPDLERWNGLRMGPERASEQLGIDEAFPISAIDDVMPGMLKECYYLYHKMNENPAFDQQMFGWSQRLKASDRTETRVPAVGYASLGGVLHELRLHKSDAELNIMRRAGEITAGAHVRAMQTCRPGMSESALEAELLYEFARQGARWPAYTSIVGGGANSCILHYIDNNQPLHADDLVLIDAGCELEGYASDLTRTFPVNGRFSGEKLALYKVVLAAQEAGIDQARPGVKTDNMQKASDRVLTEGLLDLGLLEGDLEALVETDAVQPFAIHKVGHWLGLDVHDVGNYKSGGESRPLAAGMVTTVEPGLYIAPDCEQAPPGMRGTGIRIEDAVAVTESGPEVLTAGVPKQPADIEHLMNQ